jgi:flavin-dependent dehydrogenase
MVKETDVLIIGGGLAGLSVARKIVRENISTVLVNKPIAKNNNPARLTFKDTIDHFGLSHCALGAYDSFGIFSYHGAFSRHTFAKPAFVALDYKCACNTILDELKTFNNFTYKLGAVSDLDIKEDIAIALTRDGEQIAAQVVVDASGKNHFSLKRLNKKVPDLYSHSFGQSFENCQNEKTNEAYFIGATVDYGSGGGWYYPVGKTRASVGFALITEQAAFPGKELKAKYIRGITEVEPVCSYLKKARATQYEFGTIPIISIDEFTDDRLLIVGDAAGQATPWMCMGVEPVLQNSELVGESLIQAFDKENFKKNAFSGYQEKWDKQNKKAFQQVNKQDVKIWFFGEEVWDFILEMDLPKLSPQKFIERMRFNAHLMSPLKGLMRWAIFRLKHIFEWSKFKSHPKQ